MWSGLKHWRAFCKILRRLWIRVSTGKTLSDDYESWNDYV